MKKLAIICLAGVMALSVIGLGFAKWSLGVNTNVNTTAGTLKLGWVPGSDFDKDGDPGNLTGDWHAAQGMAGATVTQLLPPENKEVATTSLEFKDVDGDGILERYDVTVDNGYPYYYNEVSGSIKAYGTVPMIIQLPKLTWMGKQYLLWDGYLYWLGKDGRVVDPIHDTEVVAWNPGDPTDKYVTVPLATPIDHTIPLTINDNWVIELNWLDNFNKQLHYPDELEESFKFQILQPAEQNHQYKFSFTIEGIQWNEVR